MIKIFNISINCLLLIASILLISCSHDESNKHAAIYTVENKPHSNTVAFSGIVMPLSTTVIVSPADGAIIDMPFQYGEKIKKNQIIFKLSSTKFMSDYKNALMQYLKAKSDYNTNQMQLNEATFLHKNKLISDDDFSMKQSSYYGTRLGYLQAKDMLLELMQQLHIDSSKVDSLSIADIDRISQAFNLQSTLGGLPILSPSDGIMLAATKSDDDTSKIKQGDMIKQGDTLALIGDLSGLTITINVNELTVAQLSVGQAVAVSGLAFAETTLQGIIQRVDRQGVVTNSGSPTFTVVVTVPHLTPLQQQKIYVGMTATVTITTEQSPALMIPMNAITEKNGDAWVNVATKSNGITARKIQTGTTTLDAVTVISGLRAGEKIVVPT